MFEFCADPSTLESARWFACYLTTGKHFAFYQSFLVVIALLLLAAPLALGMGLLGALAKRARLAPVRWLSGIYTSMVRGIPDIIFFLFVPIALDQLFEFIRHKIKCSDVTEPIWQGNDFVVCAAAKLPLGPSAPWVHDTYGLLMALLAYSIVFGAFAANVIDGALSSIPKGQIEAAKTVGMTSRQILRRVELPQMWIYALPGLSNLWQILIKATPLLFLLGVQDIVYWARDLGSSKTSAFSYPHGDWRAYYFAGLMVFYLFMTWISQRGFERLMTRAARGMPQATGA